MDGRVITHYDRQFSTGDTLDLLFTSTLLATSCSVKILDFNYSSDHFPILISLDKFFEEVGNCRPYMNFSKVKQA